MPANDHAILDSAANQAIPRDRFTTPREAIKVSPVAHRPIAIDKSIPSESGDDETLPRERGNLEPERFRERSAHGAARLPAL